MDALVRAPALVISEGYATAATIAEVVGFATVAAFDAGNLAAVARILHEKFPEKPDLIPADAGMSHHGIRLHHVGLDHEASSHVRAAKWFSPAR